MLEIQHIIDHLVKVYGFEPVPCSIPRNGFQYFKRTVYLFILSKISKRLFYFLRDKVSDIKYLDKRPTGEIWLHKRLGGKLSYELEIKPLLPQVSIYTTDTKGIFRPNIKSNFKVKVYPNLSDVECKTFPMNPDTGIKSMDLHLSDFPDLKSYIREQKLKSLLK